MIEQYDLSELDGRLAFLLALLNLSTLFRPVVELIQHFSIPEYGSIVRANGVEICFVKEYPTDMPSSAIIGNLRMLHGRMMKHGVPNVVILVKTNLKKRHVVLTPMGIVGRPSDIKQLVMALLDILSALAALHSIRLMHRDLRWDNVLKYQDRDKWFIIDFDDGTEAPASQAASHLNPASHAPEMSSSHSTEVDVWGVGYLIETSSVRDLPPQLKTIQEQCWLENPSNRPTAESLLKQVRELVVELA